MPSISVPSSFFVSERDSVYAEWRTAFFRELLSNAMDAGASKVRIRTHLEGGSLHVDVLDNGCGMSRDVIENVYMRLGASTKRDGDGIGGFGRARILTCFSHDAYRIRTANLVVTGQGASYDIRETSTAIQGCAISVKMPAGEVRRIHRGLERALRQSSLRCAVDLMLAKRLETGEEIGTISEELIEPKDGGWSRFRGWARKGRLVEVLSDENGPWASLHVNEGEKAIRHHAIVRLHGMAMYDEYVQPPVQITVDLEPSRSRSVLTASRDAIRSPFREELQKIFARIGSEKTSGLRGRPRDPETHISLGGEGRSLGRPMSARKDPEQQPAAPHPAQAERAPANFEPEDRGWAGTPYASRQNVHQIVGLREPVVVHVADATSEQRSASGRFRGETWMSPGSEGRNAEMLHAAWTAACGLAVETLCRLRPSWRDEEEAWATGFVFDRNMQACHMPVAGARHALLLNPVDTQGRMRFKTSDPSSMKEMASLAIHEACHIRESWHDEGFASLMTEMVGEIRDRDMDQAIRSALEETRRWQRRRRDAEGPTPIEESLSL